MQTLKKTVDYVQLKKLGKKDVVGLFHTDIRKVTKKPAKELDLNNLPQKYKNIWYLKKETSNGDAMREVIGQELFRLIIPNQPKTRLVQQPDGLQETVASKEVPGYRSWENIPGDELNKNIKDGTYHGLGEVLILAMLVNETDLKLANLCLDYNNQIIKLDGDCCFTRLANWNWCKGKKHVISEDDIRELPYIVNYFSNHWLDWIADSKQLPEQKIIDKELVSLKSFRDEVHRALLKTLILPDRLLRDFIRHHASTRNELYMYYNEVLARREQMKKAALKNENFCQYMLSADSKKDLKSYLEYLKEFKITGKTTLDVTSHEKSIYAQYNRLIQSSKENVKGRALTYTTKNNSEEQRFIEEQEQRQPEHQAWGSPNSFFKSVVAELDMLEENAVVRRRRR